MTFYTLIIVIAIVYFPQFFLLLTYKRDNLRNAPLKQLIPHPLLILAGGVYLVALMLPEPSFTKESDSILQHFVGGGFVSALYFLYISKILRLQYPLLTTFVLLYLTSSGLGVSNELIEFGATKFGFFHTNSRDTWWDLLANTLGAFTLYILVVVCKNLLTQRNLKKH